MNSQTNTSVLLSEEAEDLNESTATVATSTVLTQLWQEAERDVAARREARAKTPRPVTIERPARVRYGYD